MIGSDFSLPSDLTVSDFFFTAEFVRIERGELGRGATHQGTDSMAKLIKMKMH